MLLPIALSAILVCFLPFYIWTEYNWEQKKYLVTKLTSSLLFVLVATTSYIQFGDGSKYGLLIIIALISGLIGDGFLVYDNQPKFFTCGVISFLIGQLVYGSNFLMTYGFLYYDLVIYIGVAGLGLFAYSKSEIDFGEMKKLVLVYYLIIVYMFTMAISSLYKGSGLSLEQIMVAIGAVFFFSSDIMLTFNLFHKKKYKILKACVLTTYYIAQLLLALSIIAFYS